MKLFNKILDCLFSTKTDKPAEQIIDQLKRDADLSFSGWHECNKEVPTKFGKTILVLCRNKNKEDGIWLADLIRCWEGEWAPRDNWEDPVMWAYLDDLIPRI